MCFGEIENSVCFGIATYQTMIVVWKVEIEPVQKKATGAWGLKYTEWSAVNG